MRYPQTCMPHAVPSLDSLLRCPCALHHEVVVDRARQTVTCTHERCPWTGGRYSRSSTATRSLSISPPAFSTSGRQSSAEPDLGNAQVRCWAYAEPSGFGDKPMARRNAARFVDLVKSRADPDGPRRGWRYDRAGAEPLYQEQGIRLVAFDVYCSPETRFVADAHSIRSRRGD